jgi:hypothetical protein
MRDDPVARVLALDDPPARDPAFTLAVLRRAAAEERGHTLAAQAILVAAVAISAAALAPIAQAWLAQPGPVFQVLILAAGVAAGGLAFSRVLRPA